jgi:hypothetical protein
MPESVLPNRACGFELARLVARIRPPATPLYWHLSFLFRRFSTLDRAANESTPS